MVRIEFTVEPFVEGEPGEHVRAAVDAASATGADVEFGPFGSSCEVDAAAVGGLVKAVTDAAFANGATRVTMQVERQEERGS